MESQNSTFHLSFMATLSAQIAKFFNSVTEVCLNELNPRILKSPHQNGINTPMSKISAVSSSAELQSQPKQTDIQKVDEDKHAVQKREEKKKKGRPRNKAVIVSHKPKAPTSSYLLFFHDVKQQIAHRLNLSSTSDITRAASEEWRKLGEAEKAKYVKRSQQEQAKYHQAMKVYKLQYAEQIKLKRLSKEQKGASQLKDKNVKKREELQISSGSVSSSSSDSSISQKASPKNNMTGTVISIDDSNNSSLADEEDCIIDM